MKRLFLLLIPVLFGCGGAETDVIIEELDGVVHVQNDARIDTISFPYELVLEQTFGAEEEPMEATLAYISEVVVGENGTVYGLDDDTNSLVAFAADGEFLWSAGQQGNGPAELANPRGLVLLDDTLIFVGDNSGREVEIWNVEGQHIDSRQMPPQITQGAMIAGGVDEHTLFISQYLRGNYGVQGWFVDTERWEVIDSLRHVQPTDEVLSERASLGMDVRVGDGQILVGSGSRLYTWSIFDSRGNELTRISRDVDFLSGYGIIDSDGAIGAFRFSNILVLPRLESGEWLTHVSWTDVDDPHTYAKQIMDRTASDVPSFNGFDLFDAEGRYMGSQIREGNWPEIGAIMTIGSDGKLYTSSVRPYPQMRRYRLVPK